MAENAADVFRSINGYLTTRALISACNFKIFDILQSGPQTTTELCESINSNRTSTHLLLNTLCTMGYLKKEMTGDKAVTGGRFRNTELSEKYLTSSSPFSLIPVIDITDKFMFSLSHNLTYAIRDGKAQFDRTYGDATNVFELLATSRPECQTFMMATHAFRKAFHCDVASKSFDLNHYQNVCELGGGTGVVSFALSDAYPGMKLVVYDLPIVVDIAQQFRHHRSAYVSQLVTFQAGNPVKDDLPKVDLFVLSGAANFWAGGQISILFTKIYEALPPGGAVMILEPVVDEDNPKKSYVEVFSLAFLLAFGSQHRTKREYLDLLRHHGFTNIKLKKSESHCDAILASKPRVAWQ
ncbi:acetylserotonin O-methyltransferase-like [Glandiceps talaboti]